MRYEHEPALTLFAVSIALIIFYVGILELG